MSGELRFFWHVFFAGEWEGEPALRGKEQQASKCRGRKAPLRGKWIPGQKRAALMSL
jgi:hypothetical protein